MTTSMKFTGCRIYPLLLLISFLPLLSFEDIRVSIPYYSVGLIYEASNPRPIASGFVFENTRFVVTARHVLFDEKTGRQRELYFAPVKGLGENDPIPHLRLRPHRDFKAEDIAVLTIEGQNPCKEPLVRGDFSSLQIGQSVLYGGLDLRETRRVTFTLAAHQVRRITQENGLRYLEIVGIAIKGYSGGPVIGEGNRVIGVVLKGITSSHLRMSVFTAISIEHIPPLGETKRR